MFYSSDAAEEFLNFEEEKEEVDFDNSNLDENSKTVNIEIKEEENYSSSLLVVKIIKKNKRNYNDLDIH